MVCSLFCRQALGVQLVLSNHRTATHLNGCVLRGAAGDETVIERLRGGWGGMGVFSKLPFVQGGKRRGGGRPEEDRSKMREIWFQRLAGLNTSATDTDSPNAGLDNLEAQPMLPKEKLKALPKTLMRVKGMENYGNTCYLNAVCPIKSNNASFIHNRSRLDCSYSYKQTLIHFSPRLQLLQSLVQIRPLRDHILSRSTEPGERSIIRALKEIMVGVWQSEVDYVEPRDLVAEIGKLNPSFKGNRQQDRCPSLTTEALFCLGSGGFCDWLCIVKLCVAPCSQEAFQIMMEGLRTEEEKRFGMARRKSNASFDHLPDTVLQCRLCAGREAAAAQSRSSLTRSISLPSTGVWWPDDEYSTLSSMWK